MKKRKKELFWKNCKKKVLKVLYWKCLIWVFLDWNFQRTIEVFQITSLEIVKMQCFFQNKKNYIWEQNVLLCVFGRIFENLQSFVQNKKISNLGPKLAYLGTSNWNLKKLLSYLTPAPSTLSKCKVPLKTKNVLVCGQKAFIWVLVVILKNYCHIWNQHSRIC